MNLVRRRFSPLLLAAAMAACASPATVEPDATLALSPADPVVVFGDSTKVVAVYRDAAGTVLPPRTVTWSSSAPEIVSVNKTGRLIAHGWGTVRITATDGAQTAWVPVTVAPRPPAVTGVTPSPSRLNVDAADATVHMLVAVQADRGVAALSLTVEAVRRGVSAPQSHACSAPAAPASGTSRAGTWRCTIQLPRASAAGTWNVKSISVTDSLGKITLAGGGPGRSFEVESANEDLTPPVLKSLVVQPTTVNVATSGRAVQVTFTATDAASGVLRAVVGWSTDPWFTTTACDLAPPEGEGAQTANFTCSFFVPANSAPETRALQIVLVDRARNRWVFASPQLQTAGFPHAVTITR